MRQDLLDLVCCPDCRGDLRLRADQTDPATQEILEGTLTCAGCGHVFPVEEGIPNLLPASLEED
ncbi:MAG: methytransferase partner Trm112 [Euryarchaeota archaeon]|nr:methytransferase partner Trm112 [Euryarchaeota archaeon]